MQQMPMQQMPMQPQVRWRWMTRTKYRFSHLFFSLTSWNSSDEHVSTDDAAGAHDAADAHAAHAAAGEMDGQSEAPLLVTCS